MLASSSVTFSSLRCVFLWVDSVDWKLKVRPHWVHWNGLSPVWVLRCSDSLVESEKVLELIFNVFAVFLTISRLSFNYTFFKNS